MKNIENFYWDIEQMYTDGVNPEKISEILNCDIQIVYAVLTDMGVMDEARPRRGKVVRPLKIEN